MRDFIRFINAISQWSAKVLMWLPWVVTAIIIWEILLRVVFNLPTIWAHELGLMVFGALSMLGGAYALRNRGHVNMDLFYTRLSPKGKVVLDIITFPFFLLFCGVLLWIGGAFAWRSVRILEFSQSNWAPPIWPIKLTIPLGALMILLQGVSNLASDILAVIDRKEVKN